MFNTTKSDMELLHPHISPSPAAYRLSQYSYLNPEEKLTNHKNANASRMLYNSLETLQINFQNPMMDSKLQISCIIPSTIALGRQSSCADVGNSATIYLAICVHFHFNFLVMKNFPRWLYGRMTKKSKVDIVVMKKKDQKSQQSTVSASIRHSRRI